MSEPNHSIGVVIPCFRVGSMVLDVIRRIGPECSRIYVVDDACPDKTGDLVEQECQDPRVVVLRNSENLGVGGAVLAGYRAALADDIDVIVKVDGDGQMNPAMIPQFVAPIIKGQADYTKGNRFFYLEEIRRMPTARLIGNAMLSIMSKFSTGYWDLFDPTNGYTAIHRDVASSLPLDKISHRYFFETDMLFRLSTLRAVVVDIPMDAKYEGEVSNLKISKVIGEFLFKHTRNYVKRTFYNYYLRDMSLASLELPLGLGMLLFGIFFGLSNWAFSADIGRYTPAGTVMLSVLPILIGLQFILAYLAHDIASVPTQPIHPKIFNAKRSSDESS